MQNGRGAAIQGSDNIVSLDPAASLDAVQPATILLHEPEGASAADSADIAWQKISLDTGSADEHSGARPLKRHFHTFTIPLTRVRQRRPDRAHAGLALSRRLIEETLTIGQEYVVDVSGALVPGGLALLNHGLSLGGWPIAPCKASWLSENRLRFAIKALQPGRLRAMCAQVGLTPLAVRRIRIDRVSMGKLPVGQWRYLPVIERF